MSGHLDLVSCYSGSSYAQQPRSFIWQGAKQQIESTIKQELTPQGKLFLVSTPQGLSFNLEYLVELDQWQVSEAFLPKSHQVACVPGSAFGPGGEGFVRCSDVTSYQKFKQAMERIAQFIGKL